MIRVLPLFFIASAATAQPLFQDRSAGLPEHIYSGGWEHFVGGGVAVFDCNQDDLPDIFAPGGTSPAALFTNSGDFAFQTAPLVPMTGVTGVYPLDIDADGALDLFIMRVGTNMVLKGDGKCGFTDATHALGIPTSNDWTTAFTAWWEDNDQPVMAIGNYVDRANPDGPFAACDVNYILRPNNGGYHQHPLTPGFCPLSMLATNDARGRPTLRISNDRHYYVRDGYEQMWDIQDQRFLDESDGWANTALWGMGIASRDLTGDGRDEVMLTSMGDQLMQVAQADGTYAAAPFTIGTYAQRPHTGSDGRPSTGWHAEFGDIDNDGRPDLFIAKGNVDQMPGLAMKDPNNLLMQNQDGTFQEAATQAGIATMDRSRGAALADFDNDGRLDLVVVNRRTRMELYRNISANTGNWLRIDLRQTGGNQRAIGAQIAIQADDTLQTQQITIGGGHAGGTALPLHFGIGNAPTVAIEVTWPDGSKHTYQGMANTALMLHKP